MATFTMPLKRVIEITGGTTELVEGITKVTGGNIGLTHYPIFDEAYRDTLTGKIVDHYWNREIGLETPDMFQLAMRRKMNEIMPLYNKLYLSERFTFDPMKTIDLKTLNSAVSTVARESDTNAKTDSTNTSESATATTSGGRTVFSEFPQTQLNNSADYATNATDATNTTSGNAGGTENGEVTQTALETASEDASQSGDSQTSGYQGVPSDILMRYRDSLLNIDLMIISELSDLFMLIWDNGDTYSNNWRF